MGRALAGESSTRCVDMQLRRTWLCRLGALSTAVADPRERRLLADAQAELTDSVRALAGASTSHGCTPRPAIRAPLGSVESCDVHNTASAKIGWTVRRRRQPGPPYYGHPLL